MKLAFYYHITLTENNNTFYCPGYLGVFIDSLAQNVDRLYLVMHQSNVIEKQNADYQLRSENITWINLGLKTPVWHRDLFHKKFLKKPLKKIAECDAFIVRSPSPLAPYFHKYLTGQKLIFMVVGDYLESVKQTKVKSVRNWFELRYLEYNDYLFRRAMKTTDIMVNSPVLFNIYQTIAKSTHQIKTTTLSAYDFYEREDTCQNDVIELLFTGRIDPLKGLFELVEATANLRKEKFNVRLNIVGWEIDQGKPVEKKLKSVIANLGIENHVVFHGKKTIGEDLNKMYRLGDIYILPSYEEGFPRTIWEAMANSLPVITTNVGGIPLYLTHEQNVYMIEPRDVYQLTNAIKKLIIENELRMSLIKNGFSLAKENTLEIQSKRIIEIVKRIVNEQDL